MDAARRAELREEAARLRSGDLEDTPSGSRRRVWDCPRMCREELIDLLDAADERDALRERIDSAARTIREKLRTCAGRNPEHFCEMYGCVDLREIEALLVNKISTDTNADLEGGE